MYYTAGRIPIDYEYYCDVYANALKKQHITKIKSYVCVVRKQDTIIYAIEFQRRYLEKPFALYDACLITLSQYVH